MKKQNLVASLLGIFFVSCSRRLLCLAGVFSLTLIATQLVAAEDGQSLDDQISCCTVPYQPFIKVGNDAPSEAENQALLVSVRKMQARGLGMAVGDLESFVSFYPNSPWAVSVRANLGRYYYEHAMFSLATEQWKMVWKATRFEKDGAGKQVADHTFAYWTKMLLGLGRVDELKELFAQAEGRTFGKVVLQQMVNNTRNQYRSMQNQTDVSFRCGVYALNSVLKVLKNGAVYDPKEINKMPSPVTGFSIGKLAEMARKVGVEMLVAKAVAGTDLVVPSVIHWKEKHYAAIISERSGVYQVMDSVYGKARWLAADQIRQEASGYYLVAKDKVPAGWEVVSTDEANKIFGRGTVGGVNDKDDSCSNGSGGSGGGGSAPTALTAGEGGGEFGNIPCKSCGGGKGGGGNGSGGTGGNGSGCSSCSGMPVWEVSEPQINVWFYDEPLGYQPGLGDRISFKLAYKQRETRDFYTGVADNYTGIGSMWHSDWVSYLYPNYSIETNGCYWVCDETGTNCWLEGCTYTTNYAGSVTVVMADGGERTYVPDGSTPEYYSHSAMTYTTDANGFWSGSVITYPDGSKEIYSVVTPNPLMVADSQVLYRTAKYDRFGNMTRFIYDATSPLLKYVVDPDGRTNTLSYTGSLITQVQDPFGRTANLKYNSSGVLTNIVDAAGLTNSFQYDSQGWITNLITPYGSTHFEHFTDTGDSSVVSPIMRAVRVIDAVGGTNDYMFSSSHPITGYRGSSHWGPRQSTSLPADLHDWNTYIGEFCKARTTQWAHESRSTVDGSLVSQIVEAVFWPDSNPSPYGYYSYNSYTRYDYWWRSYWDGLDPSPISVYSSQPDGYVRQVWYERDNYGRPTNVIDTCSSGYGAYPDVRTNSYVYDSNGVDLTAHIGPTGETVAGYAYNAKHQVVRLTNALNEVTRYTYDTQGRLTSVATPSGLITTNIFFGTGSDTNLVQTTIDLQINRTNSYTYTNNLVYTHTDERRLTTTNTWDGLNRLRRVDYPDGTYLTKSYYRLDLVQVRDRMGFTNSYGYDAVRRMVAATNALGNFTLYDYCPCGSLESIQDAAGNATMFTYDNVGNRLSATYPDWYVVNYTYDFLNRVISTLDSGGVGTTNWYNNQGLVYAVDNAAGQVSLLMFDIEDRVTNSVDANNLSVNMTYDLLGRLLTRSYPDGGVEGYGYTFGVSGPTSYTNQISKVTHYGYDAARRKTAETNALNYPTLFGYNAAGDLLTLTDGNNNITKWGYDTFGRVTNKVDAANNLLFVYQYDSDNRLTNRWSAAKANTIYKYDAVGNLTNVVYPVSVQIKLRYDAMNRLTNMVDGVGTTAYGYDTAGQLLNEGGLWPNDTVSYSYANRLRTGLNVSAPNASAWTQGYGYDSARRLTNAISPAGEFDYQYVNTEGWFYDPIQGWYYVPQCASSRILQIYLPNGAVITNDFDSVARLTGTYLVNTSGTILDSYAYGYNQANQRTNVVRTAGDYVNYTYDNIGELQTAIGKEAGGVTNRWQEHFGYGYDAAGNLNYRTNHTLLQKFNVNSLNELMTVTNGGRLTVAGGTSVPATNVTVNTSNAMLYADTAFASTNQSWASGNNTYTAIAKDSYGRRATNSVTVNLQPTNSYTYDLNGNLLTDGTRSFAYDDENQLISVWQTNVWRNDFVYDGKLRRRIVKDFSWNGSAWAQTNEVRYIYDGNLVVQERNTNNQPVVTYTRGNDLSGTLQGAGGIGGLLARSAHATVVPWYVLPGGGPANSVSSYYHADGNGNITMLIDASQTVVAKYLYDPYGNTLAQSGLLADANTYRFSSKEWNANSGLYYYLYRLYDSNAQRWLNRDPRDEFGFGRLRSKLQGFDVNYYVFVNNSPVDSVDFLGLKDLRNFPQYGNYCGKDYCGGKVLKPGEQCDFNVKPTNAIDSCCKNHDKCYDDAEKCGGNDKSKVSDLKNKCDKSLCECMKDVDPSDLGSVGDGNALNMVRNWACSLPGAK